MSAGYIPPTVDLMRVMEKLHVTFREAVDIAQTTRGTVLNVGPALPAPTQFPTMAQPQRSLGIPSANMLTRRFLF